MDQTKQLKEKNSKVYLSGYLKIKTPDYNNYMKYYVQLRARELVLFGDKDKASKFKEHIEDKVSLRNVNSIEMTKRKWGTFVGGSESDKMSTIVINYSGRESNWREVKIKALKKEEEEEWYRYLHSMALLKAPTDAQNLLPGQVNELLSIIEEMEELLRHHTDSRTIESSFERQLNIYEAANDDSQTEYIKDKTPSPISPTCNLQPTYRRNSRHRQPLPIPIESDKRPSDISFDGSCQFSSSKTDFGEYFTMSPTREYIPENNIYSSTFSASDQQHSGLKPPEYNSKYQRPFPTPTEDEKQTSFMTANQNLPQLFESNRTVDNGHYTSMAGLIPRKNQPSQERRKSTADISVNISEANRARKISEPNLKMLKKYDHSMASLDSSSHSWFIDQPTTRTEAEAILQQNHQFGNTILRRREDETDPKWKYAISAGPFKTGKEFKHFRVREERDGNGIEFFIFLGGILHPRLTTIESVMDYFTERKSDEYKPLMMSPEVESIYDIDITAPDASFLIYFIQNKIRISFCVVKQ